MDIDDLHEILNQFKYANALKAIELSMKLSELRRSGVSTPTIDLFDKQLARLTKLMKG